MTKRNRTAVQNERLDHTIGIHVGCAVYAPNINGHYARAEVIGIDSALGGVRVQFAGDDFLLQDVFVPIYTLIPFRSSGDSGGGVAADSAAQSCVLPTSAKPCSFATVSHKRLRDESDLIKCCSSDDDDIGTTGKRGSIKMNEAALVRTQAADRTVGVSVETNLLGTVEFHFPVESRHDAIAHMFAFSFFLVEIPKSLEKLSSGIADNRLNSLVVVFEEFSALHAFKELLASPLVFDASGNIRHFCTVDQRDSRFSEENHRLVVNATSTLTEWILVLSDDLTLNAFRSASALLSTFVGGAALSTGFSQQLRGIVSVPNLQAGSRSDNDTSSGGATFSALVGRCMSLLRSSASAETCPLVHFNAFFDRALLSPDATHDIRVPLSPSQLSFIRSKQLLLNPASSGNAKRGGSAGNGELVRDGSDIVNAAFLAADGTTLQDQIPLAVILRNLLLDVEAAAPTHSRSPRIAIVYSAAPFETSLFDFPELVRPIQAVPLRTNNSLRSWLAKGGVVLLDVPAAADNDDDHEMLVRVSIAALHAEFLFCCVSDTNNAGELRFVQCLRKFWGASAPLRCIRSESSPQIPQKTLLLSPDICTTDMFVGSVWEPHLLQMATSKAGTAGAILCALQASASSATKKIKQEGVVSFFATETDCFDHRFFPRTAQLVRNIELMAIEFTSLESLTF